MKFNIKPISKELLPKIEKEINSKIKPLGSLGKLEEIAKKIGLIQNTLKPKLSNPHILVFAGDHGIAKEGVSLFPQEVTHQMVLNFLKGGAGINVFSRQNNIKIKVIDAGVNFDFDYGPELINAKVAKGTKNFLDEPAMSKDECILAILRAVEIVENVYKEGCNIIGFGEMGIGNTSSASVLMSKFCDVPLENSVGRGTGLSNEQLFQKVKILKEAIENNPVDNDPLSILAAFGGFEIAMIAGAALKSAELGMVLLIDGFISTSGLLAASKIEPAILDYCIFAHKSNEKAHKLMLECLEVEPLLDLDMRLGEGTGAAVVYPIVKASVNFLNEMATFESANVSSASG